MLYWILFLTFIGVMLSVDLGIFHRKDHVVRVSEALAWTGVWIVLALIFNVVIYFLYDHEILISPSGVMTGSKAALEFFTAYVVEKSLSLDNIFVMSSIFVYFNIPNNFQYRLLFWGVFGAIVLRALFILGGVALLNSFSWIMYIFGFVLVVSAFRMLIAKDGHENLENNVMVKIVRKIFPVSNSMNGKFLVRENGRWLITPLFVCLITIEGSDVIFAMDSIPAVFGITHDPFIAYTSNIMALLGLRHLYFALAAMVAKFGMLKYTLALVLGFIGVKMMLAEFYEIPIGISLAVIAILLLGGIAFPLKK